jgi:GNAT superfamily N-acetyltransferase
MTIRRMLQADLASVAVLAAQLGYPGELEEFRHRFFLFESDPDNSLMVAENQNGQILGWIQVTREKPSLVANARAEISALVVDEKNRGQGIGHQLVEAAEGWARQKGLSLVRIRSNVKREKAHQFYLREGYTIKKSWHLFMKSLDQ